MFWIEVTPTESRWEVWPKIQAATKQVVAEINKDPNTWFIPTSGAFLGPDQRPMSNLFQADQLHLNQTGYQIWSALIKSQLNYRLPQDSRKIDLPNEENRRKTLVSFPRFLSSEMPLETEFFR